MDATKITSVDGKKLADRISFLRRTGQGISKLLLSDTVYQQRESISKPPRASLVCGSSGDNEKLYIYRWMFTVCNNCD